MVAWQLAHTGGTAATRLRRAAPLATPFVAIAAWDTVVRVRLGAWPTGGGSESRLSPPGFGVIESAVEHLSLGFVVGVVVAIVACVLAVARARDDVLTWVSVAYGLFATTFGMEVWTHAGFTRALLPMYVCAGVAVAGTVGRPATARSGAAATPTRSRPAPSITITAP
jgi:hypothetical protein